MDSDWIVVDQCNATWKLQQVSSIPSLFIPQGKHSVWAVRHGTRGRAVDLAIFGFVYHFFVLISAHPPCSDRCRHLHLIHAHNPYINATHAHVLAHIIFLPHIVIDDDDNDRASSSSSRAYHILIILILITIITIIAQYIFHTLW